MRPSRANLEVSLSQRASMLLEPRALVSLPRAGAWFGPQALISSRSRMLPAALVFAALLPAPGVLALPEDAQQPLEITADSNELFLDRGYYVYRGTPEQPAVATQGSMKISGIEIIAEQSNGTITKVTATGTPARFQQQPEANKPVAHLSGSTLVFDNAAQLITADGTAEYIWAGNTLNGDHIEYDIQVRRAAAAGRDGQQVNMFIPPTPPNAAPAEAAPAAPDAPATEE